MYFLKERERNLNDKTDKTEIANHIGPHFNTRSVCPIFENELSLRFNKPVIITPQFIKCIFKKRENTLHRRRQMGDRQEQEKMHSIA